MSDSIITVENLSKCYILAHQADKRDGLRHALERAVRAPLQWFKGGKKERSKTSEEFWALRDVNLAIKPGEVVGLVGRNGAGKSTLLKILSRITEPTNGRIRMRGRTASLLEVGTGFHPELTGRENVYLNGSILGMSRAEIKSKFDEIVAFAGTEKFLDTPVKHYSSGMYVRLAFAVAAHLEPEILIVDEVLAVGDAAFQRKCLARMDEIAKSHGRTILFVSHNMAAVQSLCTRCVLLQSGTVKLDGTPDEIIKHYIETIIPSEVADSDVAKRTDRSGSGVIRFTDFHIEDTEGNRIQRAISGMDVVLVLSYTVAKGQMPKKVDVGFSLATGADQLLAVLYSSYTGRYLDPPDSTGTFRCRVNNLPFAAGRYIVGARIVVDHEEADCPRGRIGFLDVENGDFFGTGSTGYSSQTPYLLNGEWKVDAASAEAVPLGMTAS